METEELARSLHLRDGRVLVVGAPGVGASTLVEALADAAAATGEPCAVITADPGQPLLGPPGAVSLGERDGEGWRVLAVEALSTLDVARFRLPVALAVERLARRCRDRVLIVAAPGVLRGMAAAELLPALVRVAGIRDVVLIARGAELEAVLPELVATGVAVHVVTAPAGASPLSRPRRLRRRTAAWDAWLGNAAEVELDLGRLAVTGAPPPRAAPDAWVGRQAAVLDAGGDTLAFGEVTGREGDRLLLRARPFPVERARVLVVRDAWRDPGGQLVTAPAHAEPKPPADDLAGRPILLPEPLRPHATRLRGTLVGGLLGDPLVVLQGIGSGRVILLDLGEAPGLPARLAHRVTDVLLSHAHMDHTAGLVWLLRCRIGVPAPVRVFGPPGTAGHLAALLRAFTWDRIGDDAPRFQVAELHGDRLLRCELEAGAPRRARPAEETVTDGVILREPELVARAATLDHGIPVLAYALEESAKLTVRADRLEPLGLAPGPWLAELKRCVAEQLPDTTIALPDGRAARAGELATELLLEQPGQRLVYATDLADTPANREALVELARGAQLLLLEAAFLEEHADRARATGHLTARACGEIATAAGVERLLPFHLSSRYQARPEAVLAEAAAACQRLWLPRNLLT